MVESPRSRPWHVGRAAVYRAPWTHVGCAVSSTEGSWTGRKEGVSTLKPLLLAFVHSWRQRSVTETPPKGPHLSIWPHWGLNSQHTILKVSSEDGRHITWYSPKLLLLISPSGGNFTVYGWFLPVQLVLSWLPDGGLTNSIIPSRLAIGVLLWHSFLILLVP